MKRKIAKGLTDAKERQNQSRGHGNERNPNRGLISNRDLKHYNLTGPKVRVVYDSYTTCLRQEYDIHTTLQILGMVDFIRVICTGLSSSCFCVIAPLRCTRICKKNVATQ